MCTPRIRDRLKWIKCPLTKYPAPKTLLCGAAQTSAAEATSRELAPSSPPLVRRIDSDSSISSTDVLSDRGGGGGGGRTSGLRATLRSARCDDAVLQRVTSAAACASPEDAGLRKRFVNEKNLLQHRIAAAIVVHQDSVPHPVAWHQMLFRGS